MIHSVEDWNIVILLLIVLMLGISGLMGYITKYKA